MINKQSRIIVTGGGGFLGSHVVDRLRSEGYEQVTSIEHRHFELTERQEVCRMYRECAPDVVIHCAARVGGIGANGATPGEFFYTNMKMGLEVIDVAGAFKCKKVVVIGTTCSYPKHCETPFCELDIWKGYPEETNAPYGIAKRALLAMCYAYREQYGLNAIYLIPANLYGPRDDFSLQTGHVIPAIIRKCTEAVGQSKSEVDLWGDGTPTRDFLYVVDAARAIVLAMEQYDAPLPLNIGTGREISIRKLAGVIADVSGFRGGFQWHVDRPNGQPRRQLNTDAAAAVLGFRAETTLEDGLRETIAWYQS